MDKIKILDHGYISFIEHWGSDERIIEAARMSTNKGFLGWGNSEKPGDEKLLKYLWDNKHATPFEMSGLVIEVKAPIFVFREWHRHRTQSYNEMSARYIPLPNEVYIPDMERTFFMGKGNKQAEKAKGSTHLKELTSTEWLRSLRELCEQAEIVYQNGLAFGIPKELARLANTVNRYSKMRASANLRNWLAFLI